MSEQLEHLFRNALDDMTVDPPEGMWDRIDSRLTFRQHRRRRIFSYSGVAAAVVLLLLSVLFIRNNSDVIYVPDRVAVLPFEPEAPELRLLAGQHSPTRSISLPARLSVKTQKKQLMEPPLRSNPGYQSALVQQKQQEIEFRSIDLPSDFIPLINGSTVKNVMAYNRLLGKEEDYIDPIIRVPEKRRVVASATIEKKKEKRPPVTYTVSGYVSPGYASGDFGSGDQDYAVANAYNDSQLSGMFNVNGGVTFAVNTSKRLSIQTGIGYAKVGQKTSDATVYIPQTATTPEYSQNTEVFTPLGKMKSMSNAVVTLNERNKESLDDLRNTLPGTIEQEFGAIEIPLLIRYYINDNRVRFSISGGFGANIFVDNKSSLKYDGNTERMGKTEDIRSFNVSTHIGMGVEYPITKAIHLKVEPGFKYYLQSISHNEKVQFKPYSFNFSTGIGVNF